MIDFETEDVLAPFAGMSKRVQVFDNSARLKLKTSILTEEGHQEAMQEIRSWPEWRATPLVSLPAIAERCELQSLWYKDESSRFGLGSFKALGGAYAVLRVLQREILRQTGREASSEDLRSGSFQDITRGVTVTTATDGNHGRSVAWGAQMFGCRCVIYIPYSCSYRREVAIEKFGARVVRTRGGYDETVKTCASDAPKKGFAVVSDTSWPCYEEIPREIMLGYTVMLEEILGQLPPGETLTHAFVQGGVGGLAASVCAHFANRFGVRAPRLVVVEPEGAACLFASAQAGKSVPAPAPVGTIMAGLDCGEASMLAWDILSTGTAAFVTVPDSVVAPCMRLLASSSNGSRAIVAGESAVAGLAAVLISSSDAWIRDILRIDSSSRVLVFGTEGNTDPELYQTMLSSAQRT
jgi:diaminopropionate ammonia-lyase